LQKILAGVVMVVAAATCSPVAASNADQFRAEMIKRFAAAYPDRRFTRGKEQLEIAVDAGKKEENTVNLHRVFYYCQNVPVKDCEIAENDLVSKIGKKAPDITPASLRIIVRDAQYVGYLEELERKSKDKHLLAVRSRIGDDLFALLASDGPDTIATVGQDKLAEMKLTEAEAWPMAIRQTRPAMPAVPDGFSLKRSAQALQDYEYGASVLTDLAGWSKVSEVVGSDLFVTVVSDRFVFVGVLPDGPNLEKFRKTVQEDCATQPRCISPNIYRFRGGKWVVAGAI
jgi:hypothetical protein